MPKKAMAKKRPFPRPTPASCTAPVRPTTAVSTAPIAEWPACINANGSARRMSCWNSLRTAGFEGRGAIFKGGAGGFSHTQRGAGEP
jgi:hypothetical protein